MDTDPLLRVLLGILGLSGILPIILLFLDHRRRKEIHKPILFVIALVVTVGAIIPFALKLFGIWIALVAPALLFVYVLIARRT